MKNLFKYSISFFIYILIFVFSPAQLKAQSITWIGPFGSGFGISDVSDDGNTVVGNSFNQTLNATIASRWTASGGFQELGFLPDRNNSSARAGSSDGNVVVGFSYYYDGSQNHNYAAFRWTPSGGMQAIVPNAESSQAWDVSGDGSVVVGNMILSGDINSRPFRWTANGGLEDLSSIIGYGSVTGASFDGSVIVGNTYDSLSFKYRPFRLRGNTLEIYSTPNSDISVSSVSGDGKVVVGQFGSGTNTYPFRWDTVMQNLQNPEFGYSYASRTNYNGSIIVGIDLGQFNNDKNAWRWTSSNGFQNLNIIYSSLLPNNVQLFNAASISSDGRYIAGNAGDGIHTLVSAYILDTQSNLHITEPTSISKFIAGETGLIKWTGGESGQTLKIEYSINEGITYYQIDTVQANASQYSWQVPLDILTTKAKIKLTDLLDPAVTTESSKFKIKPYILTRLDADSNYYEFRKDRDQWGFWNNPNDMWPYDWYMAQFDYQGIDPFTDIDYSQTQAAGAFANSMPWDHVDWESWVYTFGIDNCYKSTDSGIYSPTAVAKWRSWTHEWRGSCFGIAVANALAFGYKEDFFNKYPYYPDFVSPIEVTSDNQVKTVINELFIHQAGNPHLSYRSYIGLNKTPNNTLDELKNMFKQDNCEVRTLSFVNNGPDGGGHAIIAYGLERGIMFPDIYYIKVYDNSKPTSTNRIAIHTLDNNGNGSWDNPDWPGWGGSKWLYLRDPVVNYLYNPTLAKNNQTNSPFILDANELQIFNSKSSAIKIIDQFGNITGFDENTIKNDIPNSAPIILDNGSTGPPSGYSIQADNYSVVLNDFTDGIANTFFFSGNKSMMYERFGAFTGQRDSLYFDGGIFVNNPDPDYKEITLLSIINEGTQEKLFTASGLQLLQDNSVKIEHPDSNTIKIISYGIDNSYGVELNYVTENQFGRFVYSGISLYPNMSHIFVPEWADLTASNLKVLIDWESDGIIDDSLFLQNEATGIDDQGSLLSPNEFYLAQNYPNPFNPSTTISWQSPVGSHQTLKVYDVLGNEVATLVDEYREAGRYEVEFNAENLSSGIYLYKLSTGSFTETKKMTLIK